jgi:hypothetical protein
MLSCEFEVRIGLNALLTILSAVLAVSFTFGALSIGLIRERYRRARRKKDAMKRHQSNLIARHLASDAEFRQSSEPLLRPSDEIYGARTWNRVAHLPANGSLQSTDVNQSQPGPSSMDALLSKDTAPNPIVMNKGSHLNGKMKQPVMLPFQSTAHGGCAIADADADTSDYDDMHSFQANAPSEPQSWQSSTNTSIDAHLSRLEVSRQSSTPARNALLVSAIAILNGFTLTNVAKGFVWSIALTEMHFLGVKALDIPHGFVALDPARVILCATISWAVCCVGVILMGEMETNISQQFLFSVVAATGVAAVHFSGLSRVLNTAK